ncbi:glycoside hydrolase family 32 protein [Paenibacillus sp. R14(2021)]|uniref:glycoside hydrolase family 32 protein n=1 Tax=Paenibacillus sp. R14(2021) TaxID=2859228 RepID=UPI001C614723|nr:glycoside hydrolase family 32 protein [Paenibacillus sp. R14(2021)]
MNQNLYRPTYHFMPEQNWMNDPNGTIFFEGYYHLFYQYNPYGDKWGTIHWGHARSLDLVHWEHLPIALYPSGELGEVHCFSGCAVHDGTEARIFYTSIGDGERNPATGAEQWMAASTDGLLTWQKHPGNPVITSAVHGDADVRDWRDPFVWREGEDWFMVIGGSSEGKGCVTIYKSEDLTSWTFLNFLYKDEGEFSCECPLIYREGDRYVLIYSPGGVVQYITGTLSDSYQLVPEARGVVDPGSWEGYYAPNLLIDDRNRCILFGWMPDEARGKFEGISGWSGVQALPRELTLTDSGKLAIKPVPELQKLRGRHSGQEELVPAGADRIAGIEGRALELSLELDLAGAESPFRISVLRSADGQEETCIVIDRAAQQITIDRSRSSLSPLPHSTPISGNYETTDGRLKLNIFVDHSTVEAFCNETMCLSARVYPTLAHSTGVLLYGEPAHSPLIQFDLWELSQ